VSVRTEAETIEIEIIEIEATTEIEIKTHLIRQKTSKLEVFFCLFKNK
jgi:hypothetical protein